MKSKIDLANSKSFVRPHICHHCNISEHICPNCFKLYPQKQVSKRSQVSSQGPTPLFGELLKVLSFLTQFQENFNSSISFSRHTGHIPFHFHGQKLMLCGWERSLRLNCIFCLSSALIPSILSRTLFAWFLICFGNMISCICIFLLCLHVICLFLLGFLVFILFCFQNFLKKKRKKIRKIQK